jgi:PKD repeat protein
VAASIVGVGVVVPGAAWAAPPTAAFDMTPTVIQAGERATFTDRSTDDGTIVRRGWDINGDGVITDPDGPVRLTRKYKDPGCVTIVLRVTDDAGQVTEARRILTVVPKRAPKTPCPGATPSPPRPTPPAALAPPPNDNPIAAFGFTPGTPRAGEPITFTSSSTDADGAVRDHAWELDGDSDFNDASGPTATVTYRTAGARTVTLWVTDDRGASGLAFQTVAVQPAAAPAETAPPASAGVLGSSRRSPARTPALTATVRIRGQILRGVVSIRLLTVQADHGSTIIVRCSGRGCPFRTARARSRSFARIVSIKRLQRRLRAGTVIRVMVTKPGRIGRYTRFRLRSGAAPDRRDLCLRHGSDRPFSCVRP